MEFNWREETQLPTQVVVIVAQLGSKKFNLYYSGYDEDIIDHRSYAHNLAVVNLKPEKNSGLNRIHTHDLYNTGAVLYQLSYQANWELATFWARNCQWPSQADLCLIG